MQKLTSASNLTSQAGRFFAKQTAQKSVQLAPLFLRSVSCLINYGVRINILSKTIVFLCALIISIGCKASNLESEKHSLIEAEVAKAFDGLVDAAKSLDSSRYFEFFDREKFTGLNADGTVWHSFKNLESIILTGFQMVDKTVSLEFRNVKITVINQTTAILVNEYDQTIRLKSGETIKQSGGGSQVWLKSGNAWKLVSVSSSSSVVSGI